MGFGRRGIVEIVSSRRFFWVVVWFLRVRRGSWSSLLGELYFDVGRIGPEKLACLCEGGGELSVVASDDEVCTRGFWCGGSGDAGGFELGQ